MNLADFCSGRMPPGLHWNKTSLNDWYGAVRFANKRWANEARAQRNARSGLRRGLALDQNALIQPGAT